MNTHVKANAELSSGLDHEDAATQVDADTAFAPSQELDMMLDAMRDPKRFTRSGNLATMNKFAKVLETVAAELVTRDAALRDAYARLKDQQEHDDFIDTTIATVRSLKGGTFEIKRPAARKPERRGWFR